ncbi:MAG: hypothetical protein WC600_16760 [Desulfobaccales bacterium]
MRKFAIGLALGLVLVFGLAMQAMAFHVEATAVYDNLNTIENVNTTGSGFAIFEDYNETFLTPYPSHDGFAVVDSAGHFFDKVIDFTDSPVGDHLATFHITNTSPYCWSDYHFELWNADFTERATGVVMKEPFNSDDFKQFELSADGLTLNFWNGGFGGSRDVCPGPAPANFVITFDVADDADLSFGLRQIATAVPIPAALPLFGSGLLGLGLLGWRRK